LAQQRIFFATDIHGSETCFRKFLNAAVAYDCRAIILGGDITGKQLVPIVRHPDGWEVSEGGVARVMETEEARDEAARRARASGGYPAFFTVEERETGTIVGDVGFAVADGEPNVIKVGYTISPGSQGLGYATEAIQALVDYAFDTLGAEIVRAHASAENAPSIRVAEKVGMRLVERVEYREGDEVWHGVRYEVRR
jgi:RimJ/RimL family protein N-acetyltransferase